MIANTGTEQWQPAETATKTQITQGAIELQTIQLPKATSCKDVPLGWGYNSVVVVAPQTPLDSRQYT